MSAQRRDFAVTESRPEDESRDKANRMRIWTVGHSILTIMCAEKAWQNCHRGLIADDL